MCCILHSWAAFFECHHLPQNTHGHACAFLCFVVLSPECLSLKTIFSVDIYTLQLHVVLCHDFAQANVVSCMLIFVKFLISHSVVVLLLKFVTIISLDWNLLWVIVKILDVSLSCYGRMALVSLSVATSLFTEAVCCCFQGGCPRVSPKEEGICKMSWESGGCARKSKQDSHWGTKSA